MIPLSSEVEALIDRALAEDLAMGDPTTETLVSPDLPGRAVVISKQDGVLAGVDVAMAVFRRVDTAITTNVLLADGSTVTPGDVIAELEGAAASILKAERTALNFLMGLSGVATETSRYVAGIDGYKARLLDTRKTTPGLRALQKYATSVGGAQNHRRNLADGILIKDNHIAALVDMGLTLGEVVARAVENAPMTIKVEVEVEDLDQVREALEANAHILLLDNMAPDQMAEAVAMADGRALTEASGGVTRENIKEIAATGVDFISVGAITHSAPALDISLDVL